MAFIDQVQDLTSLTVSDTDELSQFLKDGVLDVTNRWLAIRPQDIESFARESSEQTSNASLHLNGAKIISVIRENGTNNQWRNCRQIFPAEQYDVTDTENLGDISGIDTLEFDFESSLIDDDSGYHIAAFVDYNGNEYPDDIEPYITSGDITVSGGEADVGSIHIAYEYTGHLYTEASELDLVAVSGETVEFYLGIMNDGSGAVLIFERGGKIG